MKKFSIILFFFVGALVSCNSHNQDKISSKNYVELAEQLLRQNKKYGENDTTADSALLKAIAFLDKAVELDSTNIQAYQDKIMILTILGNRNSEIITTLQKLLKLKPDFAEGYMQLGLIYENLKIYDSAKFAYGQAKIGFMKQRSSDQRNYNLVFVEFLITKNKKAVLVKLNELNFSDSEFKKTMILEINEWIKGEY